MGKLQYSSVQEFNQCNIESKLPDQNLNPDNAPQTVVNYGYAIQKTEDGEIGERG